MNHMVRISDEQIEGLYAKHPEWKSLKQMQDLVNMAISSITESKKKEKKK